jgi:hypothetical protein
MTEPWCRIHSNIGSRPVTWRLMMHADIKKPEAVGHLTMFWGQLSQHGHQGYINSVSDDQLEEWAGWNRKGKRGVFAQFVREQHSTDGYVNEYDEYCGKLEERRENDRLRKQKERARVKVRGRHADSPWEVTQNDGVTSLPTRRDNTKRDDTTSNGVLPTRGDALILLGDIRYHRNDTAYFRTLQPPARAALRAVGGISRVRGTGDEQWGFLAGQFATAYVAACERQARGELLVDAAPPDAIVSTLPDDGTLCREYQEARTEAAMGWAAQHPEKLEEIQRQVAAGLGDLATMPCVFGPTVTDAYAEAAHFPLFEEWRTNRTVIAVPRDDAFHG